jgi:hypothetical protein
LQLWGEGFYGTPCYCEGYEPLLPSTTMKKRKTKPEAVVAPPVLPPLPIRSVDADPWTRAVATAIEGSSGFKVTDVDTVTSENAVLKVALC